MLVMLTRCRVFFVLCWVCDWEKFESCSRNVINLKFVSSL